MSYSACEKWDYRNESWVFWAQEREGGGLAKACGAEKLGCDLERE